MTKVYYIVDKSKLKEFPFQLGKTYHQEWLQENFEQYFGTGLVCYADDNNEVQHFSGPANIEDALNTVDEEMKNCVLLECKLTGNNEPLYFGIDTFNHGPELAVLSGHEFNSIQEFYKLFYAQNIIKPKKGSVPL